MIELENAQIESVGDTDTTYGKYEASPLPAGYGVTLGNALRRGALSSLAGAGCVDLAPGPRRVSRVHQPAGRQGGPDPDRPQRQEAAPQELRPASGPAQAGQVRGGRRHCGRTPPAQQRRATPT